MGRKASSQTAPLSGTVPARSTITDSTYSRSKTQGNRPQPTADVSRPLASAASRGGAEEGFQPCATVGRSVVRSASRRPSSPCRPAAQAQSKLEARYTVSLAGIPLGAGTWVIDITGDQYTAVANGRTTGLVKLISNGSGSAGSRGTFQGASVASSGYVANYDLRQEGRRGAHGAARRRREGGHGRARRSSCRRIACRSPRRTARA